MKEHPIIFSADMVRAILDGLKTQTRRVIKPQPFEYDGAYCIWKGKKAYYWGAVAKANILEACPYGQVGDRLWGKETLRCDSEGYAQYVSNNSRVLIGGAGINEGAQWGWEKNILPARFMPRWASRILLEITEIRAERLREITERDAIKEGISPEEHPFDAPPAMRFATLWDSLNAKRGYSWDKNLWVWVISFRRLNEI